MSLPNLAIRNRTTVLVDVLLVVISGSIAYVTLPRESAPDVPIPIIMVSTVYEGVAPEDVESSVTMKIEQKLQGLKGVKEVRSSSLEGFSLIVIEFLPNVKVDAAMQYVRDKVDQAKGELPQTVERKDPTITEINVSEFPIMMISLSGDISPVRMKAFADELEDAIEAVPGVLDVTVLGAPQREIRLEIDQDRLAAYGLLLPEILTLIGVENVNISAGGLETPGTKFNVRVPAQFAQPDEVNRLPLTVRGGRTIYLTDVAKVSDTFRDRATFSRLDGRDSITLSVQKRVGANILTIAERVKAILVEARKRAPEGVQFNLTLDASSDIKMMVADLENNLAAAFTLVLVILLIFLGWRASLIVAVAVPLSMLMSFWVLQAMGYTLNMIVLFSLVLAVGMLVDNAVVIVENVYRHMQLGYGRFEAAMKGTAEVAWPVVGSTLTTVAAFLPLIFWPGVMGNFMSYLPITVIIVLLCSMAVAMLVSPVMCTIITGKVRERDANNWFMRGYRAFLSVAINHRLTTFLLSLLLLAGLGILYVKVGTGVEFFPDIEPKRAIVNIRAPQGTNVYESDRLARRVEERVREVGKRYPGGIEHVVSNVGSEGGNALAAAFGGGGSSGPHVGNLTIMFPEYETRPFPSSQIIADLRHNLTDIPGAEVKLEKERKGPPTGSAVAVRVIGRDFAELARLSEAARRMIADVPNLVNLRSDLEATRPELVFHVDRRRAMLLGVNTAIVGNFLKTAIFGNKVGTYRQFNDEYDITVRLPESQRVNIEDIFRLRVPNLGGQAVPLSSLGRFDYRGGFGTINRINQQRVVTLSGDAEGRLDQDVLRDAQARLAKLELPSGYELKYAGQKEEQDKAQAFLLRAFIVALLLVTLVMVVEFNTLSAPLVIMTTVILSMIGVFIGLIVCQAPFGIIMTGIGVISLAGVVVNNGIVLMDYTRRLQRSGMDVIAASVEAGATRLRPVMLTAACTVIGLIPTALGMSFDFHTLEWVWKSESSLWWRSMAVAVIFGMSFATLLTLVFVPSLYVMVFRVLERFGLGGLKTADEKAAEAKTAGLRAPEHAAAPAE